MEGDLLFKLGTSVTVLGVEVISDSAATHSSALSPVFLLHLSEVLGDFLHPPLDGAVDACTVGIQFFLKVNTAGAAERPLYIECDSGERSECSLVIFYALNQGIVELAIPGLPFLGLCQFQQGDIMRLPEQGQFLSE